MPANESTLIEIEDHLLALWDEAYRAYEEVGGFPPMALVQLGEKLHGLISKRLKDKLGPVFDPENPEAALIMLERMRAQILKQLEAKQRLRAVAQSS